ncbi:MAG: sigma-70 family RNA polymerase sigma factor, partial [Planctomycetia bacterium]|nr:sigma-70 family RNA polymerase sigma factor [Planctomycetia bacterium]
TTHRELIRAGGTRTNAVEDVPDRAEFQRRYEDRDHVERLLERLTDDERIAVSRYYLESASYREIAEQLRLRENSVGPLLSRALAKMRKT